MNKTYSILSQQPSVFTECYWAAAATGATVPIPTRLWTCSFCNKDSTKNFPKSCLETMRQPATGFSCSIWNFPSASSVDENAKGGGDQTVILIKAPYRVQLSVCTDLQYVEATKHATRDRQLPSRPRTFRCDHYSRSA